MANPIDIAQDFSTTLNVGGGIDASQTTGIVLTSVSGLPTDGGILCFDWANPLDTSAAEYIEYTGISGNTLTGVIRGAEGFSAHAHSNGCTIVGVVSRAHIKRLRDKLTSNDAVAIQDTSANEVLKTNPQASAVNEITIANAPTGSPPSFMSTGGDTNIDLLLQGKGTGKIKLPTLYGNITTDTDGATITLDCSVTNRHQVILGGNRIVALSNYSTGQMIILDIIQDATGSRLVSTWPQGVGLVTTMTIAAPGVLTTGQNIPTGTPIVLSTTGALPTGLTAETVYWYTNVSSTTGKLSTSLANCQAGTYITTSGSQSGVHTLVCNIRWPNQTTPTLSTGKFVIDTIGIYVKDAAAGVLQGYVSGQAL